MSVLRTLLLVDDSLEDRTTLRRYLEHQKPTQYQILEAETGEEALVQCQNNLPDLILLDYQLPDLTGLNVLAELHRFWPEMPLPVLMLTGQGDEQVAVQAMKLGAQDYLVKGKLSCESLCRVIDSTLVKVELTRQLQWQQRQQQLLADLTLKIRQSLDVNAILQQAVTGVQQLIGADRVMVYQFQPDWAMAPVAEAVVSPWAPSLHVQIQDTCFQETQGKAYCQGRVCAIADIDQAHLTPCHRELLERFQVKANLAVPILLNLQNGDYPQPDAPPQLWGLLIAHQCSGPRQWQDGELSLLNELAVQLAVAIQQAELYAQLRQLNADLETRVEQRTAELRAAEHRFRAIFNNTFQLVGLLSLEGLLLEANQTSLDFTGLTREEVIGLPFWETPWWSLSARTKRQLQRAIAQAAQGKFVRYEVEIQGKENTTAVIDFSLRPLRDETGEIVLLIPEGRDVSERVQLEAERQQAEEALRGSEARNQAMLQALPDLIMRMNKEGQYLDFFSNGAVNVLPLPHAEIPRNTVFDVLDDDLAQRRLHFIHQAIATQELQFYEQKLVVDGKQCCEEVRIVPYGQEVLVVVRDTTEHQRAEEALRRSEAKNRAMLQALPDLVMRMTADGQYLDFFSGGEVKAIALPNPEISQNTAVDGLPLDIARQRVDFLNRAVSSRTLQIYEQELVVENEVRCEEVRIVPCGEDEALVVVRDITERKQAEQALKESEERLRLVIDASQDGIWDWNIRQGVSYWSPRVYEMLHLPVHQLETSSCEPFFSLLHPEDCDRVRQAIEDHFAFGIPYHLEVRMQRPDGSYGWFWCRGEAIRDEAGQPYRMTGAISDITERKQMEAALHSLNQDLEQRVEARTQELADRNCELHLEIEQRKRIEAVLLDSQQFIQSIADSSPNVLYIYDIVENRNLYINRSVQELLGYPPESLLGIGADFMQAFIHPEDLPRLLQYPHQVARLADGEVMELEYRIRHSNGEWRWFYSRDTVFKRDQEGQAIQYIGTAQDVTERKLAEAALQESEATKQALINAIPDLLVRMNRNGDYLNIFKSDGVHLLSAHQGGPEANLHNILPRELAEERISCARQVIDTGVACTHEYHFVLDGRMVYEEARIVNCEADTVLVMVRDISARKLAEETVRRNQARFERIAANSPGAMYQFVLYPNGQAEFLYMSDRIVDILEIEADAIQTSVEAVFELLHPEDADSFHTSVQESAVTLNRWVWEGRAITPSGRNIWVQGMSQPERQEDGSVLWDGLLLDITERKQAEQELETNRRFIERVTESIPSLLYIFDLQQLRPIYVNRKNDESLGMSQGGPDQMQQVHLQDLMHPDDFSQFLTYVERLRTAQDGEVLTFEYRMRAGNGEWLWFESYDTPFDRSATGEITQIIGSALNITARKQTEAALRESEEKFRELAENINDVFWMMNGDMTERIYVSPSFESVWGLPCESSYHNPTGWIQGVHTEDQERVKQAIADLLSHGEYNVEYRILRPDGTIRWVRDRAFPIRNEQGELYRIAGIAEDISDRKQAEAEILRYRELRDTIFNNSTDALFLVNTDTMLTIDCNERAVELFEADTKASLIAIDGGQLQKRPFSLEELQAIDDDMANRGFWSQEVEYVTLKGKEFWGNLAARPLSVGEQSINLVRVTDITDRKRSEEEVRRALQREKELNDLKSRFISMTSHEFRTPLAVIASSAGILKTFGERLTPEKQQGHLQTIQTYVRHTTDLLDDILLLNRAEAGKLAFDPTPLQLIEFCQTLTSELQLSTEQHTLTFVAEVDANVAQADQDTVRMDKKLLRQILINLLVNGIKYSPEGGNVQFTLKLAQATAQFEVQDWGLGIPPADLDHLFESFHRADNVGTIQGTGLGLSVVKKCVDLHRGTVTVTSQLGEGTTFTVELPRH
ncbi:MAG TPA: PAS domain S-box protein [Leptolyngbyaceae cyanobacterium]